MQIRTRLTLQFLLIAGTIMIIASIAVYYSSATFRKNDFHRQLRNTAIGTAGLLYNNEIDRYRAQIMEASRQVNLNGIKIVILDYLNDVVYTTDYDKVIAYNNSILEKIRLGDKVSYRLNAFEVVGTLCYNRYERYVVFAAAIDYAGKQHLEKLKIILFIVCLSCFVLIAFAGWIYTNRALQPISKVMDQVDEISITSLNLRLNEGNGTDEIGRLARTFNRMLERLEKSFTLQKDFISNASHELRTPLTAINGQLDVLMMKERTNEEYKSAVTSVLDDIRQLIDLSNRLLLIARTSAEGPVHFNSKLRIDEIIWQVQEELSHCNLDYKVNIHIDDSFTDSDQMYISGDESLIKVALSNVIENACKYSENHSASVMIRQVEKSLQLIIEDDGIGIPAEEMHKVFEPFYRATNTHPFRGTGIGLSLVNTIIKMHSGEITIKSQVGEGTTVTITFYQTK